MIDKLESFLSRHLNNRDVIFLTIATFIFAVLRLPSVIEPYWYGDEGIYEVIGMALRDGRILYSEIWDNKPPILYLIYAIFAGDQFYVRLVSLLSGIASLITFYLIAKRIFTGRVASYVSTLVFTVMFALPVAEGNIANAENFMALPVLITFYILFCVKSKNSLLLTGIAGLILSLSFLTKIVAVFDFAAFSFSLFVLRFYEELSFKKEKVKTEIKKIISGFEQELIFAIAFITPILLTTLYFVANGAFPDFFRAAFSQNVGYVAYGNHFIFPNGLLYLKFFLLIAAISLTARYRRVLGGGGTVIIVWLFFSMFNALFSARPYTHYILVALPALALFIGYVLDNKKLMKVTVPLLIIVLIILLSVFKLNFRKSIPYYVNYVEYVVGTKSTQQYQAFFDNRTPKDYAIAEFIKFKTGESESVFLWGDSAQIYALSGKLPPGRYTVSYHITFYANAIEETKSSFLKNPPKYIIQLKEGDQIQNFLEGYELRYQFEGAKIYERQS